MSRRSSRSGSRCGRGAEPRRDAVPLLGAGGGRRARDARARRGARRPPRGGGAADRLAAADVAIQDWPDDLRESRGCLLEAGGQVDDALAAGNRPVLVTPDCSPSLTTLPAVVRHRPDATVLWLDAHADFNTPETTASKYLGGMCLAAACGLWDSGLVDDDAPRVDPAARRHVRRPRPRRAGGRPAGDQAASSGCRAPGLLADALDGAEVFVHLDLDVLDPGILPSPFPAPGGLSDGGLRTLLTEVAASLQHHRLRDRRLPRPGAHRAHRDGRRPAGRGVGPKPRGGPARWSLSGT